jgi:hypothetical protein
MMKKIFFLIIISLVLLCSSSCLYNGPILKLDNIEWYTTNEIVDSLTFGYVNLNLSGFTTGDKVTVLTYGDGVIEELELNLDQENKFSQDVMIQFTHMADDIPRIYSTVVTAYQGNSFVSVNLESEELTYLE